MTALWTSQHLSRLDASSENIAPVIGTDDLHRLRHDRYYWDFCPIVDGSGHIVDQDGTEVWLALSSPATGDAIERHSNARLTLLTCRQQCWRDLGHLLPRKLSPGSRDWAGYAVLGAEERLTVYFTATGTRGESSPSYRQRIIQVTARLRFEADVPVIDNWCDAKEPVAADGSNYASADELTGEPGFIKAFRDPFVMQDPFDGVCYMLFSATLPSPDTDFAGAVGIARRANDQVHWTLMTPLVAADGVTNELERPHVIVHNGLYYLFWSTQSFTFAPGTLAPTGLYGMVGESISGPYSPINDSGLVIGNPARAPYQAYSWFVLPDLRVSSFVDMLDVSGGAREDTRGHPGGTFVGAVAPALRLSLQGERATLEFDSDRSI